MGKALLDFEVEEEDGEDSSDSSDSSDSDDEPVKPKAKGGEQNETAATSDEEIGRLITLATPAVRRIAKENKVDLSKVPPTGRNGRVLKGDVMEFLGMVPVGTNIPHPTIAAKTCAGAAGKATVPVPANRVEPLKGVRKAMLKSMSESLVSYRDIFYWTFARSNSFSDLENSPLCL